MSGAEISAFLDAPRTAVLSTIDKRGFPHSAGMWYVVRGDEVHMWTYAKSQKALNLQREDRSCLLVEEGTLYAELKGVSIQGRARVVTDVEEITAIGRALYDRYTRPTTGVDIDDGPIVEVKRQATKRVGVVLPMTRVASWDHSKL